MIVFSATEDRCSDTYSKMEAVSGDCRKVSI